MLALLDGGFDWQLPVALSFGAGCNSTLGTQLAGRPVVVLAFEPAGALGLKARWAAQFGALLQGWFTMPEGLCSLALARQLAADAWPLLARHKGAVLLAVGGGSTLDMAKLLRCRPLDGDFEGVAKALRGQAAWPALQQETLWLVPTTAGTGSELTRWATLWDTDAHPAVKRSLDEPWGYAERAFVDPELTLSCPRAVTRDCGLDTLAHALEALWNRHANPVSDVLALQAARSVIEHLPALLEAPQSLHLRQQMALAALQAGMAFSQTRTALAHALSYDVTLQQGLPHGLACALWLPAVWRLAEGRDAALDRRLHQVFDSPRGALRLEAWLHRLGVETSPAALGIADAQARVQQALASPRGRNFIAAP